MLEQLKEDVCRANQEIERSELVVLTWGNVSGFDPKQKLMVIKPSGMDCKQMEPEFMIVVDLRGSVVEGDFRPSSDTPTHIELYKAWDDVMSIVHTHSDYATMFAQAQRSIPCLGTTHADFFKGSVAVTRSLSREEVKEGYEKNTGKVIAETFQKRDHLSVPAVLVSGHGPFTWGKTTDEAVKASIALEKIAKMAYGTLVLSPEAPNLPDHVFKKHFMRKHGPKAYYGQGGEGKND
ncbi:MAG: L-ribulose-5-phosphate 4-epimerase AraD [Candidatus Aminicenantes bacterium]|nr:L-ribulose-5-phosphate 4-epimerase AraD [Candidatus Aminicenantes bacterium]